MVVVINGKLPSSLTSDSVIEKARQQLRSAEVPDNVPIIVVDAQQALEGYNALAKGLESSSTRAIEAFQHALIHSNLGFLQKSLSQVALTISSEVTATRLLARAKRHASTVISMDEIVVRQAKSAVSALRRRVQSYTSQAIHLSAVSRSLEGGLLEGGVKSETQLLKRRLEDLFKGRLSWLSLIGRLRIDEVANEVGRKTNNFGADLEKQVSTKTTALGLPPDHI